MSKKGEVFQVKMLRFGVMFLALGCLALFTVQCGRVVQLGNGVKLELVPIPAGSFQMGSGVDEDRGKPVHKVELDGFLMGKYEVTQAQYEAVMGSNPSYFKNPPNPVEMVSWRHAAAFCEKLGAKTGKTFRLPTEAQWEYACRAGSTGKWCFGDSQGQMGDYAWYIINSGLKANPVGQKKPNAWGLYDMHGNVSEWCLDWYDWVYYAKSPSKNPQGPASGVERVLRGGNWVSYPREMHCARRLKDIPDSTFYSLGFRVVCVSRMHYVQTVPSSLLIIPDKKPVPSIYFSIP